MLARAHIRSPRPATRALGVLALAALTGTLGCGGASPDSSDTAAAGTTSAPSAQAGTADACRLLTQDEIAAAVGNPVQPGKPEAGPEVCDWDTDEADDVDVLLTVRLKGSSREQILCADVRKAAADGKGFSGIGEAATWTFTNLGMFNSGDLEVCDSHGYVSLSLNGKADAARLERAAVTLARAAIGRL